METNAVFSANSVRPILAGRLPDPIQGLVVRNVYNQETILKAVLTADVKLAFSAFVNDPLVTFELAQAKELFNRMLANIREYTDLQPIQG